MNLLLKPMKSAIALPLIAFLLGCVPAQLIADGIPTKSAIAYLQGAGELDRRGEYREALQKYQSFLSKPPVQVTPLLRGYIFKQMADAENGLGDYAKGEVNAREALRLLTAAHETNTSVFATAEGTLADALSEEGNYLEAKTVAEQAVSVGKVTLNPQTPSFGILLTELAHALDSEGEHRRALKLYQRAVSIMANAGPGNRIGLGTAYVNLAGAYLEKRNAKKSLELATLALATWKKVQPPYNASVFYALGMQILSYRKLKSYRRAEALIPKMLAVSASTLGPNHPDRVVLLDVAASVYIAEKKYQVAAPFLKQAVELGKRVLPPGTPVSRTVLTDYSYVLARLGQTEEAARVRAESGVVSAFSEQRR